MANYCCTLRTEALLLLCISTIINSLETILYVVHLFGDIPTDAKQKCSLCFYILWSLYGAIASTSGILAIEKKIPPLMNNTIYYFIFSIICKGIFILIITVCHILSHNLVTTVGMACGGPILTTSIDRFKLNYTLTIITSLIIESAILFYGVIIIRRLRDRMIDETGKESETEIPME